MFRNQTNRAKVIRFMEVIFILTGLTTIVQMIGRKAHEQVETKKIAIDNGKGAPIHKYIPSADKEYEKQIETKYALIDKDKGVSIIKYKPSADKGYENATKQDNVTSSKYPKVTPKNQKAAVNIYNVSNVVVTDTSLCLKTRTPSIFTICIWEVKADIYVSGNIYKTGQWEEVITRKIHNVLAQEKKITFIDIGANMGYFSLLAASVGQPVVSVEPWEKHIAKFAHSIQLNKFEDRITVFKNVVSNDRRVVRIDTSSPNNQGAARIVSEDEGFTGKNSFSVNSIILNDLKNYISTKDVVIKMDVEGHECRAFEKADEIFDNYNVLFISMEWILMQTLKNRRGAACPPANIRQLVEMLTRRGFVPYSFDEIQLDPNKHEVWRANDVEWRPKRQ